MKDRAGHGRGRLTELQSAIESAEIQRDELTEAELRSLGTILTLEGADPAYPLNIDSLQQTSTHRSPERKLPKWLLLSVLPAEPATDPPVPERATVWVSDEYRESFIKLFQSYVEKDTPTGKPRNASLVANIARIRATVLHDLWQSGGDPPTGTQFWWEIWLRPSTGGAGLLQRYCERFSLRVSPRHLRLADREVMWVEATWTQLEALPFTAVPVAEIRRPEFIDTIEDLPVDEQTEYVADLAARLDPADDHEPAVCHLDTGVARTHLLLEGSLAPGDLHTVIGTSGFDRDGHGTQMAGLALLGTDVERHLVNSQPVPLRHRLESVRILPVRGEVPHDPITYGDVTAQAVSLPEATAARRRVFCMPVSTDSDSPGNPGQPTLWSATVDALAGGTSVVRSDDGLQILTPPEPDAARLLIVSAANVEVSTTNVDSVLADHLWVSDTSPIRDPGQSWNALTVGAFTELTQTPTDPDYEGWAPLAPSGELSPHSRTSRLFGERPWPIKPDIVMEGGNVLHDGGSGYDLSHPLVCLRTTGHSNDQALTSANATSAATAQAARLAALAMATYPEYWPETIRALLVHHAEWTPPMRDALSAARKRNLKDQLMVLRRYGWGTPTEERVLYSSNRAVSLVVQDEFTPFVGEDFKIPALRLHDLPWPAAALQTLGAEDVRLRVTLSYFIEPAASRRGWRQRYSYASHGLRFDLQDPLETEPQFIQRLNRESRSDNDDERPAGSRVDWLIGPMQRNFGSLHQDEWPTSGAALATTGRLAVYPVGGWWKYRKSPDRANRSVRYSLVVSLTTDSADIDLYTPIANALQIPTAIPIDGS